MGTFFIGIFLKNVKSHLCTIIACGSLSLKLCEEGHSMWFLSHIVSETEDKNLYNYVTGIKILYRNPYYLVFTVIL